MRTRWSSSSLLAVVLAALPLVAACQAPEGSREGDDSERIGSVEMEPRERTLSSLESSLKSGSRIDRRRAIRDIGRLGTDEAVRALAPVVAGDDADLAAAAAFAIGVSGARAAPGVLLAAIDATTPTRVVGAAAFGLGMDSSATAERALIAFAERADRPAEVPNALFSHYRWRGTPPPAELPTAALLEYAIHPDAGARAGFGHLARTLKDARMIEPLLALLDDEDREVRRAAAIGLRNGRTTPWPEAQAPTIIEALRQQLGDDDALVVVAGIRALSGFPDADVGDAVHDGLEHDSFQVRAAAMEAIGALEHAHALDDLLNLAVDDPSVFVRATAATTAAGLDAEKAQSIVDALLNDEYEFVRAAGCQVLGALEKPSEEAEAVGLAASGAYDAATARLAEIAQSDPHVRVRHTALGALEGREGPVVEAALRAGVADSDPVVVWVACNAVAAGDFPALHAAVRGVPARFPGMDGADAREGALGAMAQFGTDADRDILLAHLGDEHPVVAQAAATGLATMAGSPPPSPNRAGVRGARRGDLEPAVRDVDLVVETTRGVMRIRLFAEEAPLHVAHVTAMARRGVYDGLTWHRVVADFVIQGGCPRGDGSGSAGVTLPLEPTSIPFDRGVLGMPRTGYPDSGGCQLFVMHSRAPHLDCHYTAFGKVIEGDEVIDLIDVDDAIVSVRVEEAGVTVR